MIIGITGSFGSGKTTVAKMFARLGAYMIDADKVYHSLIKPGKRCYKKIVRSFGSGILEESGGIDRKKLGEIVFKEKSGLKLLDNLVHPEIIKEIICMIKSRKRKLIVIDAPLLLETDLYKKVDKIIVVANKKKVQIKRVRSGKALSCKDISDRIRMQMSFKKKLIFADFIIDNSGSKIKTLTQVKEIWKKLGA